MTPPVLSELLRDLDAWLYANIRLIEEVPDEFSAAAERFICYVVCRSFREGARAVLTRVNDPSPN